MHSHLLYTMRELTHPVLTYVKHIFIMGLPLAFENLLFNGGRLVLQMVAAPLGTKAIASYNLAYTIMQVAQIPDISISTMVFIAAGTCMGAGRPDDLRKFYRKIFLLNTVLSAVIAALLFILRGPVLRMFHAEPGMEHDILVSLAIIMGIQIVFHTAAFVTANLLRAAGDILTTTVFSISSMWLFRVAGAYVFGRVLGFGVPGIYIGMGLDWGFRAVVFTIRYTKGRWERMHVI